MRITDELQAQLDVAAQLNDRSVSEEIRRSLEDWIERSKKLRTIPEPVDPV